MSDDTNVKRTVLTVLESDSIILRPVGVSDTQRLYELMSDEEQMRYIFPPAKSELELRELLEDVSGADAEWLGWWVVETRGNEAAIGLVMYYGRNYINSYCSIAYVINREWHRKGVASSGVRLALNFLFKEIGLNRVEAEIEIDNAPSKKMISSIGFRLEAECLRSRIQLNGLYKDVSLYAILREDYLSS